ncbi:hypothetical protein GCM10011591_33370 [Nocardia camponoti]|uniref:Uncharacterized protein n=2 Tax=Nocardia camponoti TaxID=1616106 RepID=A0A917QMK9_9NOCA|nr:hypothetical protein GCM10011591_33370 [Nocardia camponoti]
MRSQDLAWMQPGDEVDCRVDPGHRERVALFVAEPVARSGSRAAAKILRDGRRAEATVLAITPTACDFAGRGDPVMRLDLEMRAFDVPKSWRVRLIQPVPLAAVGRIALGTRVTAAFFAIDRGESVAIDFAAI